MKNLLLLTLVFVLAACSALPMSGLGDPQEAIPPAASPAAPQDDLSQNEAKWERSAVDSYRFKLHIGCFCGFRDRMPLTIEVRDGKVASMTYSDGSAVGSADPGRDFFDRFSTVKLVFAELRSGASATAEEVRVTYDPTYGFPADLYIDPIQLAADDEFSVQLSEFEVLK